MTSYSKIKLFVAFRLKNVAFYRKLQFHLAGLKIVVNFNQQNRLTYVGKSTD